MPPELHIVREAWGLMGGLDWAAFPIAGEGTQDTIHLLPFIVMRTVQGEFVPWLASQTDILAMDWHIIHRQTDADTTAAGASA